MHDVLRRVDAALRLRQASILQLRRELPRERIKPSVEPSVNRRRAVRPHVYHVAIATDVARQQPLIRSLRS